MSGLLNKTGKAAKIIFDQTKKRIGEEQGEFAKSFQRQVGIEPKSNDTGSLVNEIITQGGKIPDNLPQGYEEQMKAKTVSRLQELEAELKRIRQERENELGEYNKSQGQLLSPVIDQKEKTYLPQTSKPKGPMAGGHGQKKTRGTGEMLKNKK